MPNSTVGLAKASATLPNLILLDLMLPVMIHSYGSSSWAYEDFIEMGITVVDALQPEAAQMSPAHLKKTFGGRLSFHGCISTAGPLAYGSVEDVKKIITQTLDIMAPSGIKLSHRPLF